jgi:hypothetical protein
MKARSTKEAKIKQEQQRPQNEQVVLSQHI